MSEFSKKYSLKTGVDEKSIEIINEAYIKDGWLTISFPMYEKVVITYKRTQSMQKTADELGISKTRVFEIIHKFRS